MTAYRQSAAPIGADHRFGEPEPLVCRLFSALERVVCAVRGHDYYTLDTTSLGYAKGWRFYCFRCHLFTRGSDA